jgi:hypothetical protein
MGRGMGRGLGRGLGMGMGGVWPAGMGLADMLGSEGSGAQGSMSEVEMLRAQAEALSSHLEEIKRRIEELEKDEAK